jgi:hypothetical protein
MPLIQALKFVNSQSQHRHPTNHLIGKDQSTQKIDQNAKYGTKKHGKTRFEG